MKITHICHSCFLVELDHTLLLFDYYTNKLDIDWVTPNDYFNAYTLTDFLIARGHTEIGFCGNTRMTSGMQDRFLGYQKALLENGLLLIRSG